MFPVKVPPPVVPVTTLPSTSNPKFPIGVVPPTFLILNVSVFTLSVIVKPLVKNLPNNEEVSKSSLPPKNLICASEPLLLPMFTCNLSFGAPPPVDKLIELGKNEPVQLPEGT